MTGGMISIGSNDATQATAFGSGALRPGGRSQLSVRHGALGSAAIDGGAQALRRSTIRVSVLRNLDRIRDLVLEDRALADVRSALDRMQQLTDVPEDGSFGAQQRAAAIDALQTLSSELAALTSSQLGGRSYLRASRVPVAAAAAVAGADATSAATQYVTYASPTVTVNTISATVLDASSTLAVSSAYGSKSLTALSVADGVAGATYTLSKVLQTSTVHDTTRGTLLVGATFSGNTVTAVDVAGAAADRQFVITQPFLTSNVKLTDQTSGQSQTLSLAGVVGTNGDKVINFDQLGVSFTLNGPSTTALSLSNSLDGANLYSQTHTDYSLKLTDVATGLSQTLAANGLGEATGAIVFDFSSYGVALTLDGAAGTTGALMTALDGGTIVTAEQITEEVVYGPADPVDLSSFDRVSVRQHDASPAAVVDPNADLKGLSAEIDRARGEVDARREALRGEIDEIMGGTAMDAETARAFVASITREALAASALYANADRGVIVALLERSSPAVQPAPEREPATPARSATAEPTAPKSP